MPVVSTATNKRLCHLRFHSMPRSWALSELSIPPSFQLVLLQIGREKGNKGRKARNRWGDFGEDSHVVKLNGASEGSLGTRRREFQNRVNGESWYSSGNLDYNSLDHYHPVSLSCLKSFKHSACATVPLPWPVYPRCSHRVCGICKEF